MLLTLIKKLIMSDNNLIKGTTFGRKIEKILEKYPEEESKKESNTVLEKEKNISNKKFEELEKRSDQLKSELHQYNLNEKIKDIENIINKLCNDRNCECEIYGILYALKLNI